MARLPTCPDCGIEIENKDNAKRISGRWVCFDCLAIREQIKEDRAELYDYVARLFNMNYPTGMMMKQIKDFKEDLGYTYKGMTLSLIYWNETLGESMMNAKGVGIIPYIYEDAKKFYIEKMEVRKKSEEMDEPLTSIKTVNVHRKNLQGINNTLSNKLIDMNDL